MLYLSRSPEDAYCPFQGISPPFPPWHDATPGVCSFNLTILDTLRGLHKACESGFFDFAKFNIEEYEHYEQVENGDLNWTLANKFIAFAGPHATRESHPGGYTSLCPEDYVSYFKRRNVKLVVRLNKKYYDARKFTQHGIAHMELYFLDGSNPPDHLLAKFLEAVENIDGAVAVHCKAGLGRTGCVVGSYMMKHYRCTAEEVIGWLRICRPGSIIGPQQQWMKEVQSRMWREGDLMRSKRGNGDAGKPDLVANAKLSPQAGHAARGAAVKDSSVDRISSRMQGMQVSERREAMQNTLTVGGRAQATGGADARSLAAAAAAEEENKSQGDYLRQRRMLAAHELASGGAKTGKVNYNDEKESGAGPAARGSGSGESGRIAKFLNSFVAK